MMVKDRDMEGREVNPAFRRAANLLLIAITVVLGLFVARYHTQAFPELSPPFSMKKSDVPKTAETAAARLGFKTAGLHRAVTFGENGAAKYFLELQYGLGRLAEEVERGVSIWSWNVRFFKPNQIEEFAVKLDTEGELVGFSQIIPEAKRLPRFTHEEARARAEDFLAQHVPRHPLAELKLIETEEEERAGHGVTSFTWERTGWVWGEGTYHLHVSVAGDAVHRYYEHLDVPEVWSRDFRKRRSSNQLFQGAAGVLFTLLLVAALVQTVGFIRQRRFRGRRFPAAWALIAGLIALAAGASGAPAILASYATNDSFYAHVSRASLTIALGAAGLALMLWILGVLGDGFLRAAFPGRVTLRALFGGRGLATREALRSVVLAFPLAMISLAWVTAYYIAGRRFGIWSPSSIDHAKVFTSLFPAIEALNTGISAGWTEELIFRGLFLTTLWRLTRSKWAAIAVTAVGWGFLHSSYPQLPGYARGLELTAMGLLLGWAATRYGILTTVLSHCLYNTWIGAIIAWKTGNAAQMATAAAVSLWPAGLWVTGRVRALRRGAFEDPAEPEEPPPLPPPPAPVVDTRLRRLTPGGTMVIAFLAGALLLTLRLLPEKPLADLGRIFLTRAQVGRLADGALRQETGLEPQGFHRTIERWATMNGSDPDYLLRHVDGESLAALSQRYLFADEWAVRYFRDGERETRLVHLSPRGELRYLSRSIAETAPGAQLERDEAVRQAEDFLRVHYGLGKDAYRFLDLGMTQQKARRDYEVTFESTRWQVGESKLRWTVFLLGDELRDLEIGIKLPEEYERERDAGGWRDVLQEARDAVVGLGAVVGVVALLSFLAARGLVPWRPCLLFALVPLALAAAGQANLAPEFLKGYDTAQSLATFAAKRALGIFTSLLGTYLQGAAVLAVVIGFIRWLTDRPVTGVLLGGAAAEARRRFLHGIVFAVLGVVLLGWLALLQEVSALGFSGKSLLVWDTPAVTGYSPGAAAFLAALEGAIASGLGAGAIALLLVVLWKKRPLLCALGVGLLLLPDFDAKWQGLETVHEIFFDKAETLLEIWLFLRIFRFNPFPYLLLPFYRALLPAASLMSASAWPALRGDVVLLWVAAAAPLLLAAAFLIPQLRAALPAGEREALERRRTR